jgi:photosystem II stability/assembly factor-like uncharacterized protein
MTGDIDIESVVRASLAEHARHAPPGVELAERIIAEADRPRSVRAARGNGPWRSWTLPVVAAASVAAVVALIAGVVQWSQHGEDTAGRRTPLPPPASAFATVPVPPPVWGSRSPRSSTALALPAPAVTPLAAFRSTDLTFVSADEGWTLGSSQCVRAPSSRCIAIMHTSDGGRSWTPVPNPGANIATGGSCSLPCIGHLRFAGEQVGYAFGPDALFMTTDGGRNWRPEKGGAASLEVANGIALRITGSTLQAAPAGQDAWHPVLPPGSVTGSIVRALSRAYVRSASGGFYSSSDDGTTWIENQNPCATSIDAMTASATGSLVVMCSVGPGSRPTLLTSSDGGRSFTTWKPPPEAVDQRQPIAGADASTVFVVSPGALYRGVDRGRSWTQVAADRTSGTSAFLGFENPATGRWVTGDGSIIWTTNDAGATWTARSFR